MLHEIGEARGYSTSSFGTPPQDVPASAGGQAMADMTPRSSLPDQHLPEATLGALPNLPLPREPNCGGGPNNGAQPPVAARTYSVAGSPEEAQLDGGADEGQSHRGTHRGVALVGEISAVQRRYEDLRRARQRLELQAMSTCRTVCGGDKAEGAKLYKKPTPQVEVWLAPYLAAMSPLDDAIKEQAKLLDKFGKQLPVRGWADGINGLSPRFLAMIVGECGIGPGKYRSVSALWKRMGLAVIDGGRQRRVTGAAALAHGYVARRRSLIWNVGESIIKQQVRNPKGEDGKSLGQAHAIGVYGEVYLARKAYEAEREGTPMLAHNRAKRYMEKRLLRDLWRAWRDATVEEAPPSQP